jgi:NAD(P)-dependent dehydrogenase (short-subunit alcohol dehydrogenase family)
MNPVALITGASRGIGRGIALELAGAGYDLIINYAANEHAATEAKGLCLAAADKASREIRVELCRADISQAGERRQLVAFARQHFERIDLLVNNAGIAPKVRADILEADEASFDQLIAVNLKGPYFLTQEIARWMVEAVRTGRYTDGPPKIVTVSSMSVYTASVNRGDYCISKAGLSMLTQLYAARLAEYGIAVYEIRPGIIATDMTAPVKAKYDKLIADGVTPIKRWGEPADVGKAVLAIAQNLFPFSTGEVINVDGGFHMHRL